MKATPSSLFTAAVASLALFGCTRGGGGDNLAVVNGEAITMDEFHRYLERKPAVQVVSTQAGEVQPGQPVELPVVASLGFQALRDLVNRHILLQVAKDKGVYPSDGDINGELEFQKKSRPTFVTDLVNKGMNLDEIRKDLTLDIAKEKIITKGIVVKPDEVDAYIKDNPTEFEIPPQARFRWIVVTEENKKFADRDLGAGVAFGTVAQTYNDPKFKANQGLYPNSDVSHMPPLLQELVNKTPERGVSAWVSAEGLWVKINVEQKLAAKKVDVTDVIKENVRRKIALQKGSEATDLAKQLYDKLRAAKVDVVLPSLKGPWDIAWKNLTTTDVQANTRTGAPGAPAPTTAGAPAPGAAPSTAGTAPH